MDISIKIGIIVLVFLLSEILILRHFGKRCGVLHIDHNSSDKDIYLFEFTNYEAVNKTKYVRLKVDHDANLTSPYMESNEKEV